ncbi:DnaJ domain-containing protein [Planctomicrobium sp.]|jgi:hypothetical protein|nr:DnaJ domain-containing protein [Planctomicrobium sp.]MBT5018208.1 DnaJ domain-containing protein [Planctomicrobium sp.]MDA7528035.1 DnaJ domain-containing protein [bacterium]MDB4743515.1 DnaJ domain-containing protein [Planctomicrobium sp.]
MTEENLSDDPRHWPSNPFALLGITREATERDAKRAYTRLIRKYNPEHNPDEFRKIREAYEAAVQQIQWRQPNSPNSVEDALDQFRSDEVVPAEPRDDFSGDSSSKPSTGNDLDSQLRDLWIATSPDTFAETYTQLQKILQTHPYDEEVAVQLYWLHVLDPGLNESQTVIDILQPLLSRQGANGRVAELLLRSLNAGEVDCENEIIQTLLANSRRQTHLSELLRHRWLHLIRTNELKGLVQDLNRLESVYLDDIQGWLTLHLEVLNLLKLSRSTLAIGIVNRCREVFESHKDLELQYSSYFDRAELACELHREINLSQFLSYVAPEIRSLIMTLGENPDLDGSQKRQLLMPLFMEWTQAPKTWLSRLGKGPRLFSTLHAFIHETVSEVFYDRYPENMATGEELRELLSFELTQGVRITDLSHTCDYEKLRTELLEFCISEFVDIDSVATMLVQMTPHLSVDQNSWVWDLRHDYTLRAMVRGNLTFWSKSPSELNSHW